MKAPKQELVQAVLEDALDAPEPQPRVQVAPSRSRTGWFLRPALGAEALHIIEDHVACDADKRRPGVGG